MRISKSFFSLLVAIFICSHCYGQKNDSLHTKKESNWSLGVNTGLNFTYRYPETHSNINQPIDQSFLIGYEAGIKLSRNNLFKRLNISLGISYLSLRYKYSNGPFSISPTYLYSIEHYQLLNIPININVSVGKKKALSLGICIDPSYLIRMDRTLYYTNQRYIYDLKENPFTFFYGFQIGYKIRNINWMDLEPSINFKHSTSISASYNGVGYHDTPRYLYYGSFSLNIIPKFKKRSS